QQKTREQAETLEEQAATNHILEIISQSPTDVQPVLDAIAESAARVCGAKDATIRLVDGDDLAIAATFGTLRPNLNRVPLHPLDGGLTRAARAFVERQTVQLADAQEPGAGGRENAIAGGYRATISLPLQ